MILFCFKFFNVYILFKKIYCQLGIHFKELLISALKVEEIDKFVAAFPYDFASYHK
jgi:hypothetical protein